MTTKISSMLRLEFGRARLEGLLRTTEAELYSQSTTPVAASITAAAKSMGVRVKVDGAKRKSESLTDATLRMAHEAGLIGREMMFANMIVKGSPLPILAFRKSPMGSAAPTLLQFIRGSWWLSSQESGWLSSPIGTPKAEDFDDVVITITPALTNGSLTVAKFLRFGLRQALGDLVSLFVFTLIAGVGLAALPMLTAPIFDTVIPERNLELLSHILVFLGAMFAVGLLARFAAGVAELRIQGRIGLLVRAATTDRAIRVVSMLKRRRKGHPSAPILALSGDTMAEWHGSIWALALRSGSNLVLVLPSILAVASVSALGAIVLGGVAASIILMSLLVSRLRIRAIMSSNTQMQSWMTTVHESLQNIETLRACAAEGTAFDNWSKSFSGSRFRMLQGDRLGALSEGFSAATGSAVIMAAILTLMLSSGLAGVSSYPVVLITAAGGLAAATVSVLAALQDSTMLAVQYQLIRPFLDTEPEPPETRRMPQTLSGQIVIENLTVRYGSGLPAALSSLTLEIAAKEHIGFVGGSGAGKSSLIKAMVGLLPIERGFVKFDGIPLSDLDQCALRSRIGIVGQSGSVIPGTIFENVTCGRKIDRVAVEDALDEADLSDVLETLPLGLATPLGEAGATLSGGQIQRILLARAFATKPPILVLDEATSALDPDVQERVSHAVSKMNSTVISIAHRLDTLKHCDKIFVIDKGKIIESGTFETLVGGQGHFTRLLAAEGETL